jgi:hypothetical protein
MKNPLSQQHPLTVAIRHGFSSSCADSAALRRDGVFLEYLIAPNEPPSTVSHHVDPASVAIEEIHRAISSGIRWVKTEETIATSRLRSGLVSRIYVDRQKLLWLPGNAARRASLRFRDFRKPGPRTPRNTGDPKSGKVDRFGAGVIFPQQSHCGSSASPASRDPVEPLAPP